MNLAEVLRRTSGVKEVVLVFEKLGYPSGTWGTPIKVEGVVTNPNLGVDIRFRYLAVFHLRVPGNRLLLRLSNAESPPGILDWGVTKDRTAVPLPQRRTIKNRYPPIVLGVKG